MQVLPRIKEVRAYTKKAAPGDQGADCHDVADTHWINGHPTPIANPMSRYPMHQKYRKSWGINALGSVIVEVEAEDGTTGVGVSIGGEPACFLIENHLSMFVEGQSAGAIELIWDQMWRASTNYGRKGLTVQAISAVDLALWDLLGKLRKAPVYELLGGPVRNELPLYCTTARPDIAQSMGFVGSKIPCPYGPAAASAQTWSSSRGGVRSLARLSPWPGHNEGVRGTFTTVKMALPFWAGASVPSLPTPLLQLDSAEYRYLRVCRGRGRCLRRFC